MKSVDFSLDKSNLKKDILEMAPQISYEFEVENFTSYEGYPLKQIVVCGMGGSSLPMELLKISLNRRAKTFPIVIHRSYGLPLESNVESLHLVISFSGNTEETLASYEEALEKGYKVVAIASGGALIDKAKAGGKPYVVLPKPHATFQPRYASLSIMKAMLDVMKSYEMVDGEYVAQVVAEVSKLNSGEFESKGQETAEFMYKKTPIVYADDIYKAVSQIWKIKINENAKTPCFHYYFPELNHNEMVGFSLPQAEFVFVFLKTGAEHPRNLKRMEILKGLMEKKGMPVKVVEVPATGETFLDGLRMLVVGDWTAYYLALMYGIDPTPVDMVEEFKDLMKD
jgi:glucose/mannose-6-phosphate isomerase